MAKSKVKKPRPKPPEAAKAVVEQRKLIAERKEKAAKAREASKNKYDPKYRVASKRLKRSQRKLYDIAVRMTPKKAPAPAAAEGEAKKEG
jgi:hypothetical protein